MLTDLYYDGRTKRYYVTEDKVCSVCKVKCDGVVLINIDYRLKKKKTTKSKYNFYCKVCSGKVRSFGEAQMELVAIISTMLPQTAMRCFIVGPTVRDGTLTSFGLAEIEKLGGTTKDMTVYADRSVGLQGLKAENAERVRLICDEKDRELDLREGLAYLDELKNMEVVNQDE